MEVSMFDKALISVLEQGVDFEKIQYKRACKAVNQAIRDGIQDIDILDHLMDWLTESICGLTGKGERQLFKLIRYVETFNKSEAERMMEMHIDDMGYKDHVIFAAAHVAKKCLGEDRYKIHVVPYMQMCWGWKQKTIALLSKIPIWTDCPLEKAISQTKSLLKSWQSNKDDKTWIDEFIEDIDSFPAEKYQPPTKKEWEEISETVRLLCPPKSTTVEEFYDSIKTNLLALEVRRSELKSLISRLEEHNVPLEYKELYRKFRFEFDYALSLIKALY